MSVFEQTLDLYEKTGWTSEDFYRDFFLYDEHGGCICTDDEIVLYRSVHTDWHEDLVVDFDGVDPEGERNCWYVHVGVSAVKPFINFMPYWLPYISFIHRDRYRIIPTNKIYGQTKKTASSTSSTSTSADSSTSDHHGNG